MSNTGKDIGISSERLRQSSDELMSCARRLRYASSRLASDIERLRACGEVQNEYLTRLGRQRDLLGSDIRKVEMMASVAARVAEEADMTENTVLEYEDSVVRSGETIEMRDLTKVSELLDEVMKEV